MKTNQMMEVDFGAGALMIEHATSMGRLQDLFRIGNKFRVDKGQPIRDPQDWLSLNSTKEFKQHLEQKLGVEVAKAKRGRFGGTWVHLFLLIDAAAYLDVDFKLAVYTKFIQDNLLGSRDDSGDGFKAMMEMFASNGLGLLGHNPTGDDYSSLSRTIKTRVLPPGHPGWNSATATQLKERARIQAQVTSILRLGLVRDWDHLKELAEKV